MGLTRHFGYVWMCVLQVAIVAVADFSQNENRANNFLMAALYFLWVVFDFCVNYYIYFYFTSSF